MLTKEHRVEIIQSVKGSLPEGAVGSRASDAVRGAILSALTMARAMGFTKDEAVGMVKEEWLHLTEIDNRTVRTK